MADNIEIMEWQLQGLRTDVIDLQKQIDDITLGVGSIEDAARSISKVVSD